MKIKVSLFLLLATISYNITATSVSEHLTKKQTVIEEQLKNAPSAPDKFYALSKKKQTEITNFQTELAIIKNVSECIKTHSNLSERDAANECYDKIIEVHKTFLAHAEKSKKECLGQ